MTPPDLSTAPILKRVAWCNIWNISAAAHSDVGSLIHLSKSDTASGKTLCGRTFPKEKGEPFAQRYCKRCLNKAKKSSEINLSSLEWIA